MNRSVCGVMVSVAGLAVLGMTATLAAVQTNGAMAQTPDARLCVAIGTRAHSRRARRGDQRARGQGSSLHEGPVNTRSPHDVRFTRRGRNAKL